MQRDSLKALLNRNYGELKLYQWIRVAGLFLLTLSTICVVALIAGGVRIPAESCGAVLWATLAYALLLSVGPRLVAAYASSEEVIETVQDPESSILGLSPPQLGVVCLSMVVAYGVSGLVPELLMVGGLPGRLVSWFLLVDIGIAIAMYPTLVGRIRESAKAERCSPNECQRS